jgi:hypothetical protein
MYVGRNSVYVTVPKQRVLVSGVVLRPAKKPDAF